MLGNLSASEEMTPQADPMLWSEWIDLTPPPQREPRPIALPIIKLEYPCTDTSPDAESKSCCDVSAAWSPMARANVCIFLLLPH
ncbi:MAG: hypothetical protein KJO21_06265 [Verrucomicrobiae bacterium]|nr:hypothetical protein [Verrucomicrobiae bacterium]NNJ41740.1 hypothetical protein [Akkermansiaceae bacterium]